MSGFTLWGSLQGYGPFATARTEPLMLVEHVCVFSVMTMLVAAALFQQRKEIERLYVLKFGGTTATGVGELRGRANSRTPEGPENEQDQSTEES